jgi:hypothetical protein
MKLKFIEAYLHTYLGRDGDRYGLHFNTQNRVPLKYFHLALKQGCQIVLGTAYQNEKNTPEWPQTIPNGHKIYKIGAEIDSKIYPNWDFRFENLPSGNPD